MTEQRYWNCSVCDLEYEDEVIRESNATGVRQAWAAVDDIKPE